MPKNIMNTLLEGLVTTLLSLDYINQKSTPSSSTTEVIAVPLTTYDKKFLTPSSAERCRSNSFLSSSSSSTSLSLSSGDENEFGSTKTANDNIINNNASTMIGQKEEEEDASAKTVTTKIPQQPSYQYHCPPPITTTTTCCFGTSKNEETTATATNSSDGDYYDDNDTVFGSILRGELPAITLKESTTLLAIQDIKPRAPLHALIIPKAFVGSVFDIGGGQGDSDDNGEDNNNNNNHIDLIWMKEIHRMALGLIETYQPEAFNNNDYRLVFHIPPFNSVNHLHLHVLAPVSKMKWYYRYIKYAPQTRWCIDLQTVMERLQSSAAQGAAATPYRRPITCRPQKQQPVVVAAAVTKPPPPPFVEKTQSQSKQQNQQQVLQESQPKETCTDDENDDAGGEEK